jgi:hypothetical protein
MNFEKETIVKNLLQGMEKSFNSVTPLEQGYITSYLNNQITLNQLMSYLSSIS